MTHDLISDLLNALPPGDALVAQLSELRGQPERLSHLARLLHIEGDVAHSVIILGDGNTVTLNDQGRLAQQWAAWQASPAEARALYLSRLTALRQLHTFPLGGLDFDLPLEKLYQPPGLARYHGEWRPARLSPSSPQPLQDLLAAPRPRALSGILGQGKTTTLRYLTWAYAAQPESVLGLPGLGERLPFLVSAGRLSQVWSETPDPLAAWAQAISQESPLLHPALVQRVLQESLQEGRALLLLDALDEARLSDPARADFLHNLRALWESAPWRGNLLLLTSRPYALLQAGFETFTLLELTPPEVQRLAYRLGQALIEQRLAAGLEADSPAQALAHLTRLTARPFVRTVTPFYVTLLTLLALRAPSLEAGLRLAEGIHRLAELYAFFLQQTLRWEQGKLAKGEHPPLEPRPAFLALAQAAWDSLPDPDLRARLDIRLLPDSERAAALTFWLRSGLLWRDEFSGQLEFAHSGFQTFGVALYLYQAWQRPALRPVISDLQQRTAAHPDWSDVWEIFHGLDESLLR